MPFLKSAVVCRRAVEALIQMLGPMPLYAEQIAVKARSSRTSATMSRMSFSRWRLGGLKMTEGLSQLLLLLLFAVVLY